MNLSPGSRVGRYEIRALLGAGGMGEVYRAFDSDLEREVAIKVLRGGGNEPVDRHRRFVQEAKAASALHHPNVGHVYEIGSQDDFRFIAMELIDGETLRSRVARGPLDAEEVLDFATQIAAALAAAHKVGIVHRDVKPENVIITPDGYAKVLDFGLAKLRMASDVDAATVLKTRSGIAMGTLGYMAPEQLAGAEVTTASDVYSLGVVLYEMLTGSRPSSEGATASAVASARPDASPKLVAIAMKALAKDPRERHRDAGEMYEELRQITRERISAGVPTTPARSARRWLIGAVAFLIIGVVAAAMLMRARSARRNDALRMVERAESLMKERRLADAYESAIAAAALLPNDPRIRDVIARSSATLTIESDPPGATVFLLRFKGPDERKRMGETPLTIRELPRAEYLMTLEKPGYAAATRPVSNMPLYNRGQPMPSTLETPPVRMRLAEERSVPPGMVFVSGAAYRLSGFYRPSERIVELSDFFIDRCEVSNADFEEFVRAGGYRTRAYWKHPFVDGGRTLTFEQAMTRFRDTTGLPGPRGWRGGAPAPGRETHPVTGVSWYEAAAFAEWKGKKLPTLHQWEKAARHPATSSQANSLPWGFVQTGVDVTERSNFSGEDTVPVDSMPFGASPYGALHMAGNVSEWCRNQLPPGYAGRGGSWKDAIYAFGQTAGFPGFYSEPTLGFRCVKGGRGDEGDFAMNPSGFTPTYKPVDAATFEEYRKLYDYPAEPLGARVVEVVETPHWRREKITYQARGKTVPAYLFLPKGFKRPLQVIHFAPAGDVVGGWRTLPASIEVQLGPLIRSGRAIFSVLLEGFLGRPHPPNWEPPEGDQAEFVDYTAERVIEMRRGLDYLASRSDIDLARIGFLGISAGGGPGVFVTAVDNRYRSVAFAGTGIMRHEVGRVAAANRVNFVSRIAAPKLMLQGIYDEDCSLKSETEPMFRLLREPKRLQTYEGGHMAPHEISMPIYTSWFDETLGAVEQ